MNEHIFLQAQELGFICSNLKSTFVINLSGMHI
jgi:hypothetical protein